MYMGEKEMKSKLSNDKGITIIALIITVIITIILAALVLNYGTEEIDKAKLEDIKTTMLLIKGRAQISIEKENFETDYEEAGVIQLETNITLPAEAETNYNLTSLTPILSELEDKSALYIWEQEAMDNNGIDVEITADDFYVIDYNTKEIYSSIGYILGNTTYYSLTQLQEL